MVSIDAVPREVAPGYWITAPGLQGDAEAHPAAPPGTRSPSVEQPTAVLIQALEAAQMREVQLLEVRVRTSGPGGATRGAPPVDAVDTVVLDVPDLGDTVGQVVMAAHPGGAITWHTPVAPGVSPGGGADRGGGSTVRFTIRLPEAVTVPEPGPAEGAAGTDRGLIGLATSTLLKVFVFPVLKDAAGKVVTALATRWEADHRPERLRWYGPGADRLGGADVDDEGLGRLRNGRTLLLVHGTFSTAGSGFRQLPDELVGQLRHVYGDRMVALEHPSMSVDPAANAAWLADRLAKVPGGPVEIDVLSHSRGGLVARALAGQRGEVPQVRVGTLVHGATPNHGTPLASPEHVKEFLDRVTSLLNLFPGPTGVPETVLEALFTAVKAIVVGGIADLPGISAMDPAGEWLNRPARSPDGPVQRAIASDFEPTGALAVAFRHRVKDAIVDRVIPGANDLVVPTVGVHGTPEAPDSLVADPLVFKTSEGVHHSSIFAQQATHAALREWLGG